MALAEAEREATKKDIKAAKKEVKEKAAVIDELKVAHSNHVEMLTNEIAEVKKMRENALADSSTQEKVLHNKIANIKKGAKKALAEALAEMAKVWELA